ncbi:amidohydrolase domain protein [Myxococcus hansupus]|uniref:Amidohydrolase domain protein n=1 Tax=Pseudomyxococcus hansupus TaxID=1297742 RepID=A0A0H4X2J5_9BACT|nr:amidohydrolase family protein [Myxococcus hansupus]AKQ67880.1 amidohydrolase domain protein [Myxococcus hansupus]
MNRLLRRCSPRGLHVLSRCLTFGAALALSTSCATTGGVGPVEPGTTLFLGKVLTLDDQGTIADAVLVDPLGRILKVGTEDQVRQGLSSAVEVVQLSPGQVLMPGFIDPHLHVLPTLIQSIMGTHDLAPCLPPPYRVDPNVDCSSRADVLSALGGMKLSPQFAASDKAFVLGMNLDPSRQAFITTEACAKGGPASFMDNPMFYLDACVTKDRPVLILDQSGHLAYANEKAFQAVCGGPMDSCQPPASVGDGGGAWVKDPKTGKYTGLLQEAAGYGPFMAAVGKGLPMELMQSNPTQLLKGYEKDILQAIEGMRKAGITTVADGGLQSVSQIDAVKTLASLPGFPLRVTGLVVRDVAVNKALRPTGPACVPSAENDCRLPNWLGAGGIKIWVDGSTQGCTAKLGAPYQYLAGGHCDGAGEGRADFSGAAAIEEDLRALWSTGDWRVQMHANGNEANEWALDAFSQLQQEKVLPHRVLLIHNTVGEEALTQRIGDLRQGKGTHQGKAVPALDIEVTHLIGHVAYWGDAFVSMLGADAAKNIDPIGFDRKYGVPFSLHSDSMVSPPRPLWFVEQAVTRRTWAYPDFQKSYVLGQEHAATVEEALRAVTSVPARHHELDGLLGSIEPGKVADFVVLSANPLDYDPAKGGDPTQISRIQVLQTYLNGKATGAAH